MNRNPCRNFQRGNCHRGDSCKFYHDKSQKRSYEDTGSGDRKQEHSSSLSTSRSHGDQQPKKQMPRNMTEHEYPQLHPGVEKVKDAILQLGDFSKLSHGDELILNISATANLLLTFTIGGVSVLESHSRDIAELFVQCFSTLSVQSPILATVISLVHHQSQSKIPSLVVSLLGQALCSALANDEVHKAKTILRSLSVLVSARCFDVNLDGGLADILDVLLTIAENSWSTNETGQVAAYLAASALPWCANELVRHAAGSVLLRKAQTVLDQIVSKWASVYDVDRKHAIFFGFMSAPEDDETEAGVSTKRDTVSEGPSEVACWDTVWETCHVAASVVTMTLTGSASAGRRFEEPTCMLPVWKELSDQLTSRKELLRFVDNVSDCSATGQTCTVASAIMELSRAHKLGARALACQPNCSPLGSGLTHWLSPRFVIFDSHSSDAATDICCRLTSVEKFILADYYRDILLFFEPILNDDGTRIGSLELMMSHLLAVPKIPGAMTMKATTMDSDAQMDYSSLHFEYILVEVLLQQICRVPNNSIDNSKYFRVLLELCAKGMSFAPVVALGSSLLYEYLPALDLSVAREIARWLSFQLRNTQLSWPYWQQWWDADCAGDAPASTAATFCRLVVDKISRAVVPEQVKLSVPSCMHPWVDAVDDAPRFCLFAADSAKRDDEKHSLRMLPTATLDAARAVAARLLELLRVRSECAVVEEFLDTQEDVLDLMENASPIGQRVSPFTGESWRTEILLLVVLELGESKISIVYGLLDKYATMMRAYSSNQECQEGMMSALAATYGHERGMFNIFLDILLRRRLVEVHVAVQWLMTNDRLLESLTDNVWSHAIVETVTDATVDFVKAAVLRRREFGDDMGALDEMCDVSVSAALAITAASQQAAAQSLIAPPAGSDLMTMNAADDIIGGDEHAPAEDDEAARRHTSHGENMTVVENESSVDVVAQSSEIVLSALRDSRAAFRLLVGSLLQALAKREHDLRSGPEEEAGGLDHWSVAATSILKQILRTYCGAEAGLATPGQRVVLSDNAGVDQMLVTCSAFAGSSAESVWKLF